MPDLNHGNLTISSSAFDALAPIPERFGSDGDNISPPLGWSSVPANARSLVLIVHDPDAPLVDGFDHWTALDIDPSTDGLEAGAESGFRSGLNSLGETGWTGPAPPPGHGVHHYFFHLFAIDVLLDDLESPTRKQVLKRIDGHIIEQARLVGTYLRQS